VFKIKGVKVDAGAVLTKILEGTIQTIREKVRSFMVPQQYWQVRKRCVIDNVEPYMWRLLKGNMSKNRKSNTIGKRIYVLKNEVEARKLLFFRGFSFSRVSYNFADRKRRVSFVWYTDEEIRRDKLEIAKIRAFSNGPVHVKPDVQPTVTYDQEKKRIQLKFDLSTEDA